MLKFIPHNFLKFSFFGGASTLVYVVSSFLLVKSGLSPEISSCLAVLMSGLFSYYANTRWTFQKKASRSSFFRFYVVTIISSIFSSFEIHYARALSIGYWGCIALVVFTMPLITFSAHRLWTYSTSLNLENRP